MWLLACLHSLKIYLTEEYINCWFVYYQSTDVVMRFFKVNFNKCRVRD